MRVLSEDERDHLKKSLEKNEFLTKTLYKLFNARKESIEWVAGDDPNWVIKRAMNDGQAKELTWWINFLKEDEE